ncbi:MAG: AMP-binding enzyme, partial [Alphaproteobacteria bacterium]
ADPDGKALPAGEIGILEITGPNVFAGYWNMPEKTAEEFRADGHFITGDMATMAEDGRIAIVGRAKDLIISGGFNVYPKEVEEQLDRMPGVRESCVIGLPHPDLGEAVTAVIVPEAGGRASGESTGVNEGMNEGVNEAAITAESVAAFLADRLARFKQPRQVVLVDALPRNAMGKVQKKALREDHAGLYG